MDVHPFLNHLVWKIRFLSCLKDKQNCFLSLWIFLCHNSFSLLTPLLSAFATVGFIKVPLSRVVCVQAESGEKDFLAGTDFLWSLLIILFLLTLEIASLFNQVRLTSGLYWCERALKSNIQRVFLPASTHLLYEAVCFLRDRSLLTDFVARGFFYSFLFQT